MTGFYDRTGEFVGVLLPAACSGLDAALVDALVDVGLGPVVDVGAGTGIGTTVLAAALTGAEILAVEPHSGLRTALLAGLAADADMRTRVTVVDTDLLSAGLPERISALVAMTVIGHFTPLDRRRVWALLAGRLAPRGQAVLNLYPPTRPEHVPAAPMADVPIGRRRLPGVGHRRPGRRGRRHLDDDLQRVRLP